MRQLAHKAYVQSNGSEVHKLPEHLDHANPHSFEVADLQALIFKVISHVIFMPGGKSSRLRFPRISDPISYF